MNATRILTIVVTTLAIALVSALLLASCYWNPQQGSGGIELTIGSVARATLPPPPPTVSFARVYLYSDQMRTRLFLGNGDPYAEASISGGTGTVTIEKVPAGEGYQLVLTLGNKPDGSNFVPAEFVVSGTFSVTANNQTPVKVGSPQTTQSILGSSTGLLYNPSLLGANIVNVAISSASSPDVAVATPSTGYVAAGVGGTIPTAPTSFTSFSPTGGTVINSVSAVTGSAGVEIWLNTTNGIQEFTTAGAVPSSAILPAGGPSGSVRYSGAAWYGNGDYAYYETDSTIGAVNAVGGSGTWLNLNLAPAVPPSSGPTFATSNSTTNGYFIANFGAFAMSGSLLSPSLSYPAEIASHAGFFTISPNGTPLHFISLATATGSAPYVIVGTNNGAYYAPSPPVDSLASTGGTIDLTSTATAIPGTAGYSIRRIVSDGSASNIVAISDNLIFIYRGSSTTILPLAGVTLGEFHDAGVVSGTVTYIVIAGSGGLTFIPL